MSAKPPADRHERRPLYAGIWCDYGNTTILGGEGIGVFLLNLVEGLLRLDDELVLALLVADGDQQSAAVSALKAKAGNRVHVLPKPVPSERPILSPRRAADMIRFWIRSSDRAAIGWDDLQARLRPRRRAYATALRRRLDRLIERGRSGDARVLATGAVVGPPAFALAWSAYTGWQVSTALGKGALLPVKFFDHLVRRLIATLYLPEDRPLPHSVLRAGCDAWLIPYVGLHHPLPPRSVLVIHDLVHLHHPEVFPPEFRTRLDVVVLRRSAEAALVACMAKFIRDTDLIGALRLPLDKTRVIPPAAPSDLPQVSEETVDRLVPPSLRRPFLLYPAAFRPYKNHRALVDALCELRDRGADWLDLVFTGTTELPFELAQMIDEFGLQHRVHVLGFVDRSVLAALYRRAFATIVPSFYEEICFPIYEALQSGCPVAGSRIAPFLEHYGSMGDAMLYFDPAQPGEIAEVVLAIRADRDGIRERQRVASQALRRRTWDDAAREWLAILREAAESVPSSTADHRPVAVP